MVNIFLHLCCVKTRGANYRDTEFQTVHSKVNSIYFLKFSSFNNTKFKKFIENGFWGRWKKSKKFILRFLLKFWKIRGLNDELRDSHRGSKFQVFPWWCETTLWWFSVNQIYKTLYKKLSTQKDEHN